MHRWSEIIQPGQPDCVLGLKKVSIGKSAIRLASSFLIAVFGFCGIFSASALASPRGLPIIVYHQIRETPEGPPDSLEPISLDRFTLEMGYLHEHGYVTLSAEEVESNLQGATSSDKNVANQFDDGWKTAQLALPE